MLHFLGIGAQKAGTSWLYENLRRHPQIRFPSGKEVHFWDYEPNYLRGFSWYLDRFPPPPAGVINGEFTPAYAILPLARIAELRAMLPALRLIYILRNPIDRAWSSALMALSRAEMRFEEASDAWFLDHFRSAGSLRRGDYASCLETWLAEFDMGNFLILFFEEIEQGPLALLRKCEDHLGIGNELSPKDITREKVFFGSGEPIRPALRHALLALYAPRIEALEGMLGCSLAHWRT